MELVSCQPPDDFLLQGVLSFNALMGLSCYTAILQIPTHKLCFNALMGLSCYFIGYKKANGHIVFQCPHGLELLLQECPIF